MPAPATPLCPRCKFPVADAACAGCGPAVAAPRRGFFAWDLMRGALAYGRGALDVLNHPTYLGKIKLAVLLNLLLWTLALLATWFWLGPWVEGLLDFLPHWLVWVASGPALILLTLLLTFLLFPVVLSLFLGPVLDPLARLAERDALGFEPPGSTRGFWEETWDAVDTGARVFVLELLVLVVCLPLGFLAVGIPVGLALGSFLAGMAWLDYPMTRRGLTFGQKLASCRRNWALTTGLGAGFLLACLIPFFGMLLAGPAAAVAAGALYVDFEPPARA
ncbi:MAG: EI24 domain-containing protein [Planctomycetota bacterium]